MSESQAGTLSPKVSELLQLWEKKIVEAKPVDGKAELKAKSKGSEEAEREKLERDRLEQDRIEQDRIEQERLEKERVEQARLEQERLEQERLAKELLDAQNRQREKLVAVDEALLLLDTARKDIKAPYPDGPDDKTVKGLTDRRDALAGATTTTEIEFQLGLGDELLSDIGGAKDTAIKAQQDWQDRDDRTKAVRLVLNEASAALNHMKGSRARALESTRQKHENSFTALARASAASEYELALGGLEGPADSLVIDIYALKSVLQEPKAEKALVELEAKARDFAKIVTPHALTADVARLRSMKELAELGGEPKDDYDSLNTIVREAKELGKEADRLLTRRVGIENTLNNAAVWAKAAPTGSRDTLNNEHSSATAAVRTAFAASNLPACANLLKAAGASADTLCSNCITAAVPGVADNNMKGLAAKARAFDKIASPNPVRAAHDRLLLDQSAAASQTGTTRTATLKSTAEAALKAYREADAAQGVRNAIAKQLHAIEQVAFKELNLDAMDPLRVEKEAIHKAIRNACTSNATGTISAMKLEFDSLALRTEALKTSTEEREADEWELSSLEEEAKDFLEDLDEAIQNLPASPETKKMESERKKLEKRFNDAPTLPSEEATATEYLRISRALEKLLLAAKRIEMKLQLDALGPAEFDKLILGMGKSTEDEGEQMECRAALEVRFGLSFDAPEGMKIARLPTIYKMFTKVPPKHVGHTKLTKLEYESDPDINTSYYGGGRIALNRIGNGDSTYEMEAQDGTKRAVNYFKATTLHEIGHAVDDRYRVMKMDDDGFGGWKRVELPDVAAKVYETAFTEFVGTGKGTKEDALKLITALLSQGKAKPPASESDTHLGSLFGQWEAIRKSDGWTICTSIRGPDTNRPWNNPRELSDGYAYHEAYASDWVRYKFSERAKGISKYQWRAPGEWFADLYALYHLTKGKDGREITLPPAAADAITKDPATI